MIPGKHLAALLVVSFFLNYGFTYFWLITDDTWVLENAMNTSHVDNMSSVDYVVVAGAWRRMNGTLSLAFQQRLAKGVAVALRYNATAIVLTGGRNDSHIAQAWLLHSWKPAESFIFDDNPEQDVDLSPEVRMKFQLLRQSKSLFGWMQSIPTPFRFLVENVSKTTVENAIEAAKVIQADENNTFPGRGGSVAVVSSPYHLRRCKILFERHLKRRVFTVGSPAMEFELTLPSHTIYWMAFTRNTSAAPKPAWEVEKENNESDAAAAAASTSASAAAAEPVQGSAQPGAQQGLRNSYRVNLNRFPGSLLPDSVVLLAHTIYVTWRHWIAHLRAVWLSAPGVGALREIGAFPVNFYRGAFSLTEIVVPQYISVYPLSPSALKTDAAAVPGDATPGPLNPQEEL